VQQLVIATHSMPSDMWIKTRVFSWMTAFLYFNKLIQIPLILMHEYSGASYRDMIELFINVQSAHFPLIAEIRDHFFKRAEIIQNGGPEYFYSKEWLDIWWPDDEYQLIHLSTKGKLDLFYQEAQELLENLPIHSDKPDSKLVLAESIKINHALLKQPNLNDDIEIQCSFNILETYQHVLEGKPIQIQPYNATYHIKRSTQIWEDWASWCREVVWYGNKKGDYLYGSNNLEKYYAGHY